MKTLKESFTGISIAAFYLATFLLSATPLIMYIDFAFLVVFAIVMSLSIVGSIEVVNARIGLSMLSLISSSFGNAILILWINYAHFNRESIIELSNLDTDKVNHSALDITYYIATISAIVLIKSLLTAYSNKKDTCENVRENKDIILKNIAYLRKNKDEWIETSGPILTVKKLDIIENLLTGNTSKIKANKEIIFNIDLIYQLADTEENLYLAFVQNRIDTKEGIKIKVNGNWIDVPKSIDIQ